MPQPRGFATKAPLKEAAVDPLTCQDFDSAVEAIERDRGDYAAPNSCMCSEPYEFDGAPCMYFECGYPWCRSCGEHHRPPECAIDMSLTCLGLYKRHCFHLTVNKTKVHLDWCRRCATPRGEIRSAHDTLDLGEQFDWSSVVLTTDQKITIHFDQMYPV